MPNEHWTDFDEAIRRGLHEVAEEMAQNYPADRAEALKARIRLQMEAEARPPTNNVVQLAPRLSGAALRPWVRRLQGTLAAPLAAAAMVVVAILVFVGVRDGGSVTAPAAAPTPAVRTTTTTTAPPPGQDNTAASTSAGGVTSTGGGTLLVTDLSVTSIQGDTTGVTAKMYFGRAEELVAALAPTVTFAGSVASIGASTCVQTVVFAGVSGSQAAVYAYGLGTDWGAAEEKPSQLVATDNGIIHQQVVVPPATVEVGAEWAMSAQLVADERTMQVGPSILKLLSRSESGSGNSLATWDLGGSNVTCEIYSP